LKVVYSLKINMYTCILFLHGNFRKNNKPLNFESKQVHRQSQHLINPVRLTSHISKFIVRMSLVEVHCKIRFHIPSFFGWFRDWIIKAYINAIIISALLTISAEYCCLNEY